MDGRPSPPDLTRWWARPPMCGRPFEFKSGMQKSTTGASAVMCPALRCGDMTAAQMGSASEPSTRLRFRNAPLGGTGYLARRFDRSPSSALALSPSVTNGSANRRLWPVGFSTRHHGPHDTGHLVGQGDGGELLRPPLQQPQQPCGAKPMAWPGKLDHRGCAKHQQLAQPFIALARDPAQPGLAGGRVLLRRQPEPGGEMPPRFELARID